MASQPGVMVWGGLALLVGLAVRPLGQVVGWVAWVFLTYTVEAVRLTARVPLASLPVQMEGWMVWGYYALLGGLTWWLALAAERRRELWAKFTARLEWKVLAGAAVILLVLAFFAWRGLPDSQLHVTFLDVGEGDAIFIQTPAGQQILVDGGPSESALLSQLGRRMPFWDRTLDAVVLTHPEADHITGLIAVLDRYQVDTVIFHETAMDSAASLADAGCPRRSPYPGISSRRSLTAISPPAARPGTSLLPPYTLRTLHGGCCALRPQWLLP